VRRVWRKENCWWRGREDEGGLSRRGRCECKLLLGLWAEGRRGGGGQVNVPMECPREDQIVIDTELV
jgi:hypothetical protein